MARPANTYRAARRNQWRLVAREFSVHQGKWAQFNRMLKQSRSENAKP